MPVNWQPLRATVALLLASASAVASIVILLSSNNQPVDEWFGHRSSPTVMLAVCAVVANISVQYALSEGLSIQWWLQAAPNRRNISSYKRLRDIYEQGTSVWVAVWGGLRLKSNRAGFACVASVIVALNGPLLQRASKVESVLYTTDVDIMTNLAAEAPFGFSGLKSGRVSQASALQPRFAQVVKSFNQRDDIVFGNSTGCKGNCKTEIEGMGFTVNCTEGTYPYNLAPMIKLADGTTSLNYNGSTGFSSKVQLRQGPSGESMIDIATQYKTKNDTVGNGVERNCTLIPATVKYPVTLLNSTVSLSGTIFDDKVTNQTKIVEIINSSPGATTLGGYLLVTGLRYNSAANVRHAGAVGYAMSTTGTLVFDFMQAGNNPASYEQMTWGNPMDAILQGMRELMFRSAVAEGPYSGAKLKASRGTMTLQRQVYKTDHTFLGLGVTAVILGVLGVIPLFWRMWQLDEPATLNPTTIAVSSAQGKLCILKSDGSPVGTESSKIPLMQIQPQR
ncbi:hypothetical protein BZA77DRAFT_390373 [Pyronema omphalodes]|nr:hypothetical protein BZA77DRAFT_390373 [Pyronema omphalodes]